MRLCIFRFVPKLSTTGTNKSYNLKEENEQSKRKTKKIFLPEECQSSVKQEEEEEEEKTKLIILLHCGLVYNIHISTVTYTLLIQHLSTTPNHCIFCSCLSKFTFFAPSNAMT